MSFQMGATPLSLFSETGTTGREALCEKNLTHLIRFDTPERAAKNRVMPPTNVLHFYNTPLLSDDQVCAQLFHSDVCSDRKIQDG